MSAAENFQLFSGLQHPLQETFLLDLFRHVQEELYYNDAVVNQVLLKIVDLLKSPIPNILVLQRGRELLAGKKLGMHAHDKDFFIVRTVENSNSATSGQNFEAASQIIVVQFLT